MSRSQLPILYINLASRPDRRAFMEGQFAALGIHADRVEAKTPADVPAAVDEAARLLEGGPRLRPGEIACTLSHFAAWQQAIESGAHACLVLEDDAELSHHLPEFLEKLGPTLPRGIDLLKIETNEGPVRLGRTTIGLADFTVRRLTSSHFGSCGYVISTSSAADLKATMPFETLPIDRFLFARTRVQLETAAYQLLPALARQLAVRPAEDTSEAARSDLATTRTERSEAKGRKLPRRSRVRANLAAAWRDLLSYGLDTLIPRTSVLFADDDSGP